MGWHCRCPGIRPIGSQLPDAYPALPGRQPAVRPPPPAREAGPARCPGARPARRPARWHV